MLGFSSVYFVSGLLFNKLHLVSQLWLAISVTVWIYFFIFVTGQMWLLIVVER